LGKIVDWLRQVNQPEFTTAAKVVEMLIRAQNSLDSVDFSIWAPRVSQFLLNGDPSRRARDMLADVTLVQVNRPNGDGVGATDDAKTPPPTS
jgi:hypothetical protein